MSKINSIVHQPVLLDETLHYLHPQAAESYLDATAGYGGHAAAVLQRTKGEAVLVDRDPAAVSALQERCGGPGVEIIKSDFAAASAALAATDRHFDLILADLGVSSPHLENTERGFSFKNSGPLDMRMDSEQETTASSILNKASERELVRILTDYGQEPKAWAIARAIVAQRPLKSTDQLAAIAAKAWPGHSKVHPATRTFQALRIAVNDELGQLERSLPLWLELLKPDGRLVLISFHSLEDRLVKRFLAEHAEDTYDAELRLLTKKSISASNSEIVNNPRARSAKLRAAVKIKTKIERKWNPKDVH